MTIKEISVKKRVQASSRKKKNLSQTVFLNAGSQPDQYYRGAVFMVVESRDDLYAKTKIADENSRIVANCIGLPRPFY